jgi:putative ABC transport system ATP-binding protein
MKIARMKRREQVAELNQETFGHPASSGQPSPLVRIVNLSKSYIEGSHLRPILSDVNVTILSGESVAILGKSGSGKSTLLNLISGIDRPDSGTIWFGNESLVGLGDHEMTLMRRRHIGFIFQSFNLIPTLTVQENILLPVELDGITGSVARERAAKMMELVDLTGRDDTFPDRLSGGEQQRVAIARALIHDPTLLLADEPTGNLDDDTGHKILSLLYGLTRHAGKNLVMVTHSREAASMADRVFYLRDGQLVEDGDRPL